MKLADIIAAKDMEFGGPGSGRHPGGHSKIKSGDANFHLKMFQHHMEKAAHFGHQSGYSHTSDQRAMNIMRSDRHSRLAEAHKAVITKMLRST